MEVIINDNLPATKKLDELEEGDYFLLVGSQGNDLQTCPVFQVAVVSVEVRHAFKKKDLHGTVPAIRVTDARNDSDFDSGCRTGQLVLLDPSTRVMEVYEHHKQTLMFSLYLDDV